MREIKFRARHTLDGSWYYGCFNPVEERNELWLGLFFQEVEEGILDKETLGEYIGLEDKNAVEIYKGDIVIKYPPKSRGNKKEEPYDGINFQITYIPEYAAFHADSIPSPLYLYELAKDYKWDGDNVKFLASECEVIGKIYENPELLEAQNG